MNVRCKGLVGAPFLLLVAAVPAAAGGPQGLPVTLRADPTSHDLRWADSGGALEGEVPWVLRDDLRGPGVRLEVELEAGGETIPAEALRFRVLAGGRVEYHVEVTREPSGGLAWSVTYDDGRELRLFRCVPRPTEDPRACLRGGVPRPLMEPLVGSLEARPAGAESYVPVVLVRFVSAPHRM
jgi:hypothetical protein